MNVASRHGPPRRHLVPGLAAYGVFLGISIVGSARQVPDIPAFEEVDFACEGPHCPQPQALFDEPDLDAEPEPPEAPGTREALARPPEPQAQPPTPAPEPTTAEPASPDALAPRILARLETAEKALSTAGRSPGKVLQALQAARAELDAAERDLRRFRETTSAEGRERALLFARDADRARGRLLRTCLEFDSAVRRVLAGPRAGLEDPFAAPERLLDDARQQVARAAQASAAIR